MAGLVQAEQRVGHPLRPSGRNASRDRSGEGETVAGWLWGWFRWPWRWGSCAW